MHEPYRLAEKVASPSATRRVALVAWGMSVCLILSATVIWFLEGDKQLQYAQIISTGIAFGSFGIVGALIIWQRPRNTIGWICLTVGIGTGITDFSGAYTAYGTVKGYMPLPGTEVFNWLGNIVWPFNLVLILVFLPLLFPDGHPLTPTMAHRRLAGSSAAAASHAGEWSVCCPGGRVWERLSRRFLEMLWTSISIS